MNTLASNAGYAEEADRLAVQYEEVAFSEVHREMLHLFPEAPSDILDIGAGTGRDAAALAALGHRVVAVEPTAELRAHGRRLHPDSAITWIDDALPTLPVLRADDRRFDLVLLTAVWMHLAQEERPLAMDAIVELLADGGQVLMTVRHGPVPVGRRMFDAPTEEILQLAHARGLELIHRAERADLHGRGGVRWSELALRRAAPAVRSQ
ncbi:class I SAM-dependent methyltransferase [Kitasatospora sp. NPDC054939]